MHLSTILHPNLQGITKPFGFLDWPYVLMMLHGPNIQIYSNLVLYVVVR